MNLILPCPVCGEEHQKECLNALSRFVVLLANAQSRVSTSISTSKDSIGPQGTACIDKLCFRLSSPVSIEVILHRLTQLGRTARRGAPLTLKQKRLKEGFFFNVTDGTNSFFLKEGYPIKGNIEKVVTRPSAYTNAFEYFEIIKAVFSDEEIANALVSRIDFAVDYPASLLNTLKSLDIKGKRIKSEYLGSSGMLTGMRFGVGSEKIVVYDKPSGESQQNTRIEIQLTGSKVPIKNPFELLKLPERLQKTSKKPFESIRLQNLTIPNPSTARSEAQKRKRELFIQNFETRGYFAARAATNTDNNFERDLGHHLNRQDWSDGPFLALMRDIKRFLLSSDFTEN